MWTLEKHVSERVTACDNIQRVNGCCHTQACSYLSRFLVVPMSRLTSAQVISLGEYLEPDFDSSTLTVSQLLGVLGFHNIRYPTPYTKGKLVQLFNDKIKPRASKFKRERIKNENSMASDDGIMDGITGEPLNGKTKVPIKCLEPLQRISIALGRSYATVFATLVGSIHSSRSTNASRTCVLYLIFSLQNFEINNNAIFFSVKATKVVCTTSARRILTTQSCGTDGSNAR